MKSEINVKKVYIILNKVILKQFRSIIFPDRAMIHPSILNNVSLHHPIVVDLNKRSTHILFWLCRSGT